MSDVYYYKNKLDSLLRLNQSAYEQAKVNELIELLKKMVLDIDREIEEVKKKAGMRDF